MSLTLVVHDHNRPFAADLARLSAMVLGPSHVTTPAAFCNQHHDADFVVVIDDESRDIPFASAFIRDHKEWLRATRIALLTPVSPSDNAMATITQHLGVAEILRAVVPPPEKHKPWRIGRYSFGETVTQLLALSRARPKPANLVTRGELLQTIETILASQSTCVLALSSADQTRAIPIKYIYENGHVFMLHAGGEELGYALICPSIAIVVRPPSTSETETTWVELKGRARIHAPGSDEHTRITGRFKLLSDGHAESIPHPFVLDATLHEASLVTANLGECGAPAQNTFSY